MNLRQELGLALPIIQAPMAGAQGAAMALEDAWTIGRLRGAAPAADWPALLGTYAQTR